MTEDSRLFRKKVGEEQLGQVSILTSLLVLVWVVKPRRNDR